VAKLRSAEPDEIFLVHPDNVVAVRLFQAMGTQWNAVALSTMDRAQIRRTGLRYEAIEVTARLEGLDVAGDDFRRLRIMEIEAIAAWGREA
jgi:hypothetical protein